MIAAREQQTIRAGSAHTANLLQDLLSAASSSRQWMLGQKHYAFSPEVLLSSGTQEQKELGSRSCQLFRDLSESPCLACACWKKE